MTRPTQSNGSGSPALVRPIGVVRRETGLWSAASNDGAIGVLPEFAGVLTRTGVDTGGTDPPLALSYLVVRPYVVERIRERLRRGRRLDIPEWSVLDGASRSFGDNTERSGVRRIHTVLRTPRGEVERRSDRRDVPTDSDERTSDRAVGADLGRPLSPAANSPAREPSASAVGHSIRTPRSSLGSPTDSSPMTPARSTHLSPVLTPRHAVPVSGPSTGETSTTMDHSSTRPVAPGPRASMMGERRSAGRETTDGPDGTGESSRPSDDGHSAQSYGEIAATVRRTLPSISSETLRTVRARTLVRRPSDITHFRPAPTDRAGRQRPPRSAERRRESEIRPFAKASAVSTSGATRGVEYASNALPLTVKSRPDPPGSADEQFIQSPKMTIRSRTDAAPTREDRSEPPVVLGEESDRRVGRRVDQSPSFPPERGPDFDRFVDRLSGELERRIRIERERRGG